MRIGVNFTPKEKHFDQDNFTERWIEYCRIHKVSYKLVNAYDNDIINQLEDCSAFMWNHNQGKYQDLLFAKQLLFALEQKGIKVFPDFKTGWHFDDKVGQKYLLEALDVPFVSSYVFYTKDEALKWIKTVQFPKVFKLRGGAGSSNVKLIKSKREAKHIIQKAFNRGFKPFDSRRYFKEKLRLFKEGKDNKGLLKGIYGILFSRKMQRLRPVQNGYVYFQDFIPNNKYDIRVVIVNNKAFAIKRLVRKNDFRASGSGNIIYDKSQIDERCVSLSFRINESLSAQSIAFDYIFDSNNNPLIVEISYGFKAKVYDDCEGYWDEYLKWYPGKFDFCGWMVEMMTDK